MWDGHSLVVGNYDVFIACLVRVGGTVVSFRKRSVGCPLFGCGELWCCLAFLGGPSIE